MAKDNRKRFKFEWLIKNDRKNRPFLIIILLIKTFARSHFNPKNSQIRHPRESGDSSNRLIKMDSRFRTTGTPIC